MACVVKRGLHVWTDGEGIVIARALEPPKNRMHVVRVVIGAAALLPLAALLPIHVLAVALLDVGGILQHHLCEIGGRPRREHFAVEPPLGQHRERARMVDVRVREENRLDRLRIEAEGAVTGV